MKLSVWTRVQLDFLSEARGYRVVTISKRRFIKASSERIFRALTDTSELERWFVQEATVDLKPDGKVVMNWAPGMGEHGKVVEVKAPTLFRFTWEGQFSPTPTILSFELVSENGGTSLILNHSGIGEGLGWEAYAAMNQPGKGWDAHLQDLASWVETGTCPPPGPRG